MKPRYALFGMTTVMLLAASRAFSLCDVTADSAGEHLQSVSEEKCSEIVKDSTKVGNSSLKTEVCIGENKEVLRLTIIARNINFMDGMKSVRIETEVITATKEEALASGFVLCDRYFLFNNEPIFYHHPGLINVDSALMESMKKVAKIMKRIEFANAIRRKAEQTANALK